MIDTEAKHARLKCCRPSAKARFDTIDTRHHSCDRIQLLACAGNKPIPCGLVRSSKLGEFWRMRMSLSSSFKHVREVQPIRVATRESTHPGSVASSGFRWDQTCQQTSQLDLVMIHRTGPMHPLFSRWSPKDPSCNWTVPTYLKKVCSHAEIVLYYGTIDSLVLVPAAKACEKQLQSSM
jgi:hypothetical protein